MKKMIPGIDTRITDQILTYLDLDDVPAAMFVCKAWYQALRQPGFWHQLYQRDFPLKHHDRFLTPYGVHFARTKYYLDKTTQEKLLRHQPTLDFIFNTMVRHYYRNEDGSFHVTARNEAGQTVLHWAAMCNQRNLIPALCEQGADINAASHNGTIPLTLASGCQHLETFSVLLDLGSDVRNHLVPICMMGNPEILRLLSNLEIDYFAVIPEHNMSLLNLMYVGRKTENVGFILKNMSEDGRQEFFTQSERNPFGQLLPNENDQILIVWNHLEMLLDCGLPDQYGVRSRAGIWAACFAATAENFLSTAGHSGLGVEWADTSLMMLLLMLTKQSKSWFTNESLKCVDLLFGSENQNEVLDLFVKLIAKNTGLLDIRVHAQSLLFEVLPCELPENRSTLTLFDFIRCLPKKWQCDLGHHFVTYLINRCHILDLLSVEEIDETVGPVFDIWPRLFEILPYQFPEDKSQILFSEFLQYLPEKFRLALNPNSDSCRDISSYRNG